MKKILLALALASVSVATFAQSDDVPTKKYSVATNSFWSNWFIQGGVQWTAFYSSAEHGFDLSNSPFKSFRSNPQVAVAIGKWFTPGLGLRTKVSGIWGKAQGGTNWSGKEYSSFKYWNAQEQVLFNVSNMLCGYNPNRVYNFIPFAGAGFARNMSLNTYAMGLSVGILNEFNISKKVAINLELGWNRLENDFYSTDGTTNNGERGWDSHDNYLYAEVGLTYNLGKTGWDAVPDVDALNAQHQAALDALNAKLADAEKDNANLRKQLANQPKPQPAVDKTITELITTQYYNKFIKDTGVSLVSNDTFQLLTHSTAALVTSGTATLETALFDVPQVVCYETPLPTLIRFAFNHIIKVRFISLVNLIADKEIVPELLADRFRVANIADHLYRILPGHEERKQMLEGYQHVHAALGDTSAPDNAARIMIGLLQA